MSISANRRDFLKRTSAWGLISMTATEQAPAAAAADPGTVVGEPTAERVGKQVLAEGGNAVDAAVAAALAAGVAAPHQTGVGGYGGAMMIAPADGRPVVAIDFNTAAPQAMRPDTFQLDAEGKVRDQANDRGWLAAGVPGVLSGMQTALDRYGTRSFGQLVQGAIALARDGITIEANLAGLLRNHAQALAADPGSRKLFFRDDKPLVRGDTLRNPELAELLGTLAARNSADSFYRGDIAQRIAAEFARHGGLVTTDDLASYRAREVTPLSLAWGPYTILTPPPTAGGLTTLQALHALKALDWAKLPSGFPRTHARIEALRLAWHDRLQWLGDPGQVEVPIERLLSAAHADDAARRVRAAVAAGRLLEIEAAAPVKHGGTISLSAVDRQGMLVAVTLTHGNSFGTRVTLAGLGVTLGHGMSRFDPHPGHPNAPGPGKRPQHNMCPCIVLKDGRPLLAVGGRGGRKIVNAVFDFLLSLVALGKSPSEAIAAPRLHTEGNLALTLEKSWPAAEVAACRELGFTTTTGPSAILSAAWQDAQTGRAEFAGR